MADDLPIPYIRRREGVPTSSTNLTGMLSPGRDVGEEQAVVLLTFGTIQDIFVPVFTSKETFDRGMVDFDLEYTKIKQITDSDEFIQEVPMTMNGRKVRIVIDIHYTDKAAGKTRWREVLRD